MGKNSDKEIIKTYLTLLCSLSEFENKQIATKPRKIREESSAPVKRQQQLYKLFLEKPLKDSEIWAKFFRQLKQTYFYR